MPDVDSKLVTALRQAKTNPMFFAFVAKGASDGALLVDKKTIPVKLINEAKTETGGKQVFKGRCLTEDGKMIFEVAAEPPSTLGKVLKTIINRDAGMTMQVVIRVATDLEEEQEGAESSETPTAEKPAIVPPAPDAAALMKRLNALTPAIKTALTGPSAAQVQSLFAHVQGLLKTKDYPQAAKTLDAMEALLAKPIAPTTTPDAAALLKRLNVLTPDIKTALSGPTGPRVQGLVAAVQGFLKTKEYPQAGTSLDELEKVLTQKQPTVDPEEARFEQQLAALQPQIDDCLQKNLGDTGRIRAVMAFAHGKAEASQWPAAFQSLKTLTDLLQQAQKSPGKDVAATETRGTGIAYRKAMLRWQSAKSSASAAIDTLYNKALQEFPDQANRLKVLQEIMANLNEGLSDTLDAADKIAKDSERAPLHDIAVELIDEYLDFVSTDELIAYIDDNPWTKPQVQDTLQGALKELAAQLR